MVAYDMLETLLLEILENSGSFRPEDAA